MAAVGMTVTVQRQKHENGRPAHHANDTATVCNILNVHTTNNALPDTTYLPSFSKTHGHPSPLRYARIHNNNMDEGLLTEGFSYLEWILCRYKDASGRLGISTSATERRATESHQARLGKDW